jgi:predicted amidophosphoribosyltransferase
LSWPLRAAWHHLGQLVSLDGVTVVCVPHARRAWLTRGRHPTWELIRYARLPGVRLSGPLTLRHEWSLPRYASPQKSLTRRQRLHHPPRMVSTAALDARRVVLVDDVLTTGMSLEYAARALEAAGALIVGAVVVAATPSRHHLT